MIQDNYEITHNSAKKEIGSEGRFSTILAKTSRSWSVAPDLSGKKKNTYSEYFKVHMSIRVTH